MAEILEEEKAKMAEIQARREAEIKIEAEKRAEAADRVKKSHNGLLGLVDRSVW